MMPHDDRKPEVVPQWIIDSEINRKKTPEGRKLVIDTFRHCRECGYLLGDWQLPEA